MNSNTPLMDKAIACAVRKAIKASDRDCDGAIPCAWLAKAKVPPSTSDKSQ